MERNVFVPSLKLNVPVLATSTFRVVEVVVIFPPLTARLPAEVMLPLPVVAMVPEVERLPLELMVSWLLDPTATVSVAVAGETVVPVLVQ